MSLRELVVFRDDLLFNGAVQLGWLEHDLPQAEKAAQHYVFHGPDYHGASEEDYGGSHFLVDTATFTGDILEHIYGVTSDDPFALAIAGYGTGKSHLGVTLACLCSQPQSIVAQNILKNLKMADATIGDNAQSLLKKSQPFIVVALNGMQDFDLNGEIIRQILKSLTNGGYDTKPLEDLRPRFKIAQSFTESLYKDIKKDFVEQFKKEISAEKIIDLLRNQDEETFHLVSLIYEQKMGSPIRAVGQESLHDFIRVTKDTYCGIGKPFAGILIIFDEFGRYMEFSVQKPHIAGSGALQQLFECVQANSDGVFLLSFIQYELKTYISRIAPELRDDLNRYITRYDTVKKVRLSTNLETLIANLFEKRNQSRLEERLHEIKEIDVIHNNMQAWFPELRLQSLWKEYDRFRKVIVEGCWPLHPIATWVLNKLSFSGKSLQQRSALSLLSEVYDRFTKAYSSVRDIILPVDLCNESLIGEFLATEHYGQQGAIASNYETVISKYQYQLDNNQKVLLKAILLAGKIGVKLESKDDCFKLLSQFSGFDQDLISTTVQALEKEYGVLEWNEELHQYEIIGDAVPRRNFLNNLEQKASLIETSQRAQIFAENYHKWSGKETHTNIDFGAKNNIYTSEWDYEIRYADVASCKGHIKFAVKTWQERIKTDEPKGILIYCYLGAESNLDNLKSMVSKELKNNLIDNNIDWEIGAPIVVLFLHDSDGKLGDKLAEQWVIEEQLSDEERSKFHNYIIDKSSSNKTELVNLVSKLERERHLLVASVKSIQPGRLSNMLSMVFDKIYYERIEFPFDGFSTARGNAAKDSQLFTRQLFRGLLDRVWLTGLGAQQKNRGEKVLDKNWGIFDDDGSLRLKPRNEKLRNIINLLERMLEADEDTSISLNLGYVLRLLCRPPYGLNIASAGLVLALFVGKRKDNINLIWDGKMISVEAWLPEVLQKNFLDMAILEKTYIELISSETISEWEGLLEDWNIEETHIGKINFNKKAQKLKELIPIPQALYYKYENLSDKAKQAQAKIDDYDDRLSDALEKIHVGIRQGKVNILAWGAFILNDLLNNMEIEDAKWLATQKEKVSKELAAARIKVQEMFPSWYKSQIARNIEGLGDFKNKMRSVERNLENLGLDEERTLLVEHVKLVEKNIRHLDELKQVIANIEKLVNHSVVNDSTTTENLNDWLDQVQVLARNLNEATERTNIGESDMRIANNSLAAFQKECNEQVERNKGRLINIYNIEEIKGVGEIIKWKQEVALLISVFANDINAADLDSVQIQLDLLEKHFNILDDTELYETELKRLLEQCYDETQAAFIDDSPPLDCAAIYASIYATLKDKRSGLAAIWMENNVPSLDDIVDYDATKALQAINSLRKRPKLLRDDQVKQVKAVMEACEKRLDELEVEGLLAKFYSLSEENQKIFIRKIERQIHSIINGIA